jgi:hypothetical protein
VEGLRHGERQPRVVRSRHAVDRFRGYRIDRLFFASRYVKSEYLVDDSLSMQDQTDDF